MSAVSIGGDLVHYEVLGRGRAVLLLHGWVGSWRYWVPTMQQLHLKYRVFAVDLYGFGDSAKNPKKYNPDEQLRMLLSFLRTIQQRKVAVVAHGLGAWVAAELARRAPEMIAKMMLINAPVFDPGDLMTRPLLRPAVVNTVTATPPSIDDDDSRGDEPLASLGRRGYTQQTDRPLLPDRDAFGGNSDPTIPNARLINRARLQEAAASLAALRAAESVQRKTNEDNPLYKRLAGQEPGALLGRTLRRSSVHFDKLNQDVSRTDARVLTQSSAYYDPGAMLDTLRQLNMPVVMVHGEEDPLIDAPNEALWNHLTADKEDLCVPVPLAVGHFPMLDYNAFPRLLGSFLDTVDISQLEIKERWRRRSR
jgi:pimeloyl-ACP methyl ester carboxylesterase